MNRTKEQVEEGNKLIDKFCDKILQQRNVELDYHLNWNHLHMAVERFEQYIYYLYLHGSEMDVSNFFKQDFTFFNHKDVNVFVHTNIHVVWNGLIQFIKWENGKNS